jgi:hypothetical protein
VIKGSIDIELAVSNGKITWEELSFGTPHLIIESTAKIGVPLIFDYVLAALSYFT